jgi:serine/threonine protein kinase
MSEIRCLRCQSDIEGSAEACPQCGERVTGFQRTYSTRLLDSKYQILDRLGVGGMGEIFKVRHIHLNEQRVIKIMRANIASDDQALQRFLSEARMATMIKHRNLAMLYDFSTLDDGSYYMVWEFIEGTNIQKWTSSNGPMPPRLVIEVAIQALHGLEALHQMGIIHRDISPENIMLSQDHMGKLLIKVIDFGIAKQLSDGESGQGLTQTGMFLGKLKYASPEQAGFIKEGEQLDARSDLYSFGVVVYEMLAGRAPFLASNPHGYILKHATEAPQPIGKLVPGVEIPPKLEEIVFRALGKDRDKRHATAAEFIAELEAIRHQIAPDSRFGTGERLTTLSSQSTSADAVRPAPTPPRPVTTSTKAPPQQTFSTRAPADEATIVGSPAGAEATVVGGEPYGDSLQPTVVGVLHDGGEATLIEPSAGRRAEAQPREATVVAPLRRPEAKSRKGAPLWIAIAAVVLIAVAGSFLMLRESTTPDVATGETIETTATPLGDLAVVQLNGPIAGRLQEVRDLMTDRPIEISEEQAHTPSRLELPPGRYRIVVAHADGERESQEIVLTAGDIHPFEWSGRTSINLDSLVTEILPR